jgi:hypothetical protein
MLEPAPNRGHGQRSAALTALQETQRQAQELGLQTDGLGLRAAIRGRLPNPWARIDVHAAISLFIKNEKRISPSPQRGRRCVDGGLKHNSGDPRMPPGVRDRCNFETMQYRSSITG